MALNNDGFEAGQRISNTQLMQLERLRAEKARQTKAEAEAAAKAEAEKPQPPKKDDKK